MDVQISCECGQSVTVTEAAAGREIDCACGRTVKVPSFRELRERAGMPAHNVSPALMLSHLIESGELYPPADCVWCGAESDDVMHVTVECEREWLKRRGGIHWGVFFFSPLLALITRRPEQTISHGRDVILSLPITVCPACRARHLSRPPHRLLWVVPLLLLCIGLFVLFIVPVVGIALIVGFVATLTLEMNGHSRHRRSMIDTLRHVPLYAQLLDRYPDAQLRWSRN